MLMVIDDDTPRPILQPEEVNFIDGAIDLIQAKRIIHKLETACEKALTLRGLMLAANEKYALEGEKRELRERIMKIEIEIRAAIFDAEEFRLKEK